MFYVKGPSTLYENNPNPKANPKQQQIKKGHFANFCKIVLYANLQSCLLCYPDRIA